MFPYVWGRRHYNYIPSLLDVALGQPVSWHPTHQASRFWKNDRRSKRVGRRVGRQSFGGWAASIASASLAGPAPSLRFCPCCSTLNMSMGSIRQFFDPSITYMDSLRKPMYSYRKSPDDPRNLMHSLRILGKSMDVLRDREIPKRSQRTAKGNQCIP